MAFLPKIDFCLEQGVIKFKDVTDVFNPTDNPGGWEDATTISGGDVVSAFITITTPELTSEIIQVNSQIPSTVEGIIAFTNEFVFTMDGIYKVKYEINTFSDTYIACKEKYFYPKVKCCISNIVKKVIKDPNNQNLLNDLIKIKAWEKAFNEAAGLMDKKSAEKLLGLMEKYCNHSPCGCK